MPVKASEQVPTRVLFDGLAVNSASNGHRAHTYDYAGNRLTRDVVTATGDTRDQKYTYDDLHRLFEQTYPLFRPSTWNVAIID